MAEGNTSRLAVLSHILPPFPSGQATVLARLLQDWDPSSVCLLQSTQEGRGFRALSFPLPLPVPDAESPAKESSPGRWPPSLTRITHALTRRIPFAVPATWWRARKLAEYLRATGYTRLLVCTGGFADIPVGFLAGRWARVPVVAHYFDWYGMQWPTRPRRMAALWIESRIIRGLDAVIVPNEALRDTLVARYGVQPVVIHNPCHEHALTQPTDPKWPSDDGEISVVYTGAVYHAHFDAFRNLALALAGSAPAGMRLHVYTSQPPSVLQDQGIEGRIVSHAHLPTDSIAEVQRHADVLFLPLAFESPIEEILRTSAPGKMGDYLATGRPILVHAPPDSFLSRYFKEHECGVVVDTNSPSAVAGALERIATDEALRKAVGEKARERARIDFDPVLARAAFRRLMTREEVS